MGEADIGEEGVLAGVESSTGKASTTYDTRCPGLDAVELVGEGALDLSTCFFDWLWYVV